MENFSDKRLQRLLNEAYWIFTQLYRMKYPDLYYNGCDIEYDDGGCENISDDTFGHYIIVNGKDYYAVNIDRSIEQFGFNNYKGTYPEAAVEVIKFKGNIFANDQIRYCVDFQVNPENGEFIEAFDAFANYDCSSLSAKSENLSKMKPEPINMGDFKYLCTGFQHDFDND